MACLPFAKARWGKDGGLGGKGNTPLAPAATEGGRRPCPLRRRKLRASTAEMGGVPSPQQIEHFQFEMLCISNHTACRFAEKAQFFRSLLAGRRCAAAFAFHLFQS